MTAILWYLQGVITLAIVALAVALVCALLNGCFLANPRVPRERKGGEK